MGLEIFLIVDIAKKLNYEGEQWNESNLKELIQTSLEKTT